MFVLGALSFCFWPSKGVEYVELATGLTRAMERDPTSFDAERLASMTPAKFVEWLPGVAWPLVERRSGALVELGCALAAHGGSADAWVRESGASAARLVDLVRARLPMFRDECATDAFEGGPVYFYKRAQILAADVWAACGRKSSGFGGFADADKLTCFADYRVPQLLRDMGVLVYSPELALVVDSLAELEPGSEFETDIRACTVAAVELLRDAAARGADGKAFTAVEIGWMLWHKGEATLGDLRPHHRTRTHLY